MDKTIICQREWMAYECHLWNKWRYNEHEETQARNCMRCGYTEMEEVVRRIKKL